MDAAMHFSVHSFFFMPLSAFSGIDRPRFPRWLPLRGSCPSAHTGPEGVALPSPVSLVGAPYAFAVTRRFSLPASGRGVAKRRRGARPAKASPAKYISDVGKTEPIAKDSLYSPSPVSYADILPRWGKNKMMRRICGVVRIRRTVFVNRVDYRRATTRVAPTHKLSVAP